MKKSKAAGGEIVPAADKKLVALAMQLDLEVRHNVSQIETSIVAIGKALEKLKDKKHRLWRFVTDKQHKTGFQTWEDYATSRLGAISHGRIHELVAAASLTEGENPIPAKTVNAMGVKKAAEVYRLEPQDRTPDIVNAAADRNVPVAAIKEKVQEKINMKLPEEERKESTQFFARNLTARTVALIEEIELDGVWMEGIRDQNTQATLRDKLWHAVWVTFRENYQQELKDAMEYRKAYEAKNAAGEDEEEETSVIAPPEPEPVHIQ